MEVYFSEHVGIKSEMVKLFHFRMDSDGVSDQNENIFIYFSSLEPGPDTSHHHQLCATNLLTFDTIKQSDGWMRVVAVLSEKINTMYQKCWPVEEVITSFSHSSTIKNYKQWHLWGQYWTIISFLSIDWTVTYCDNLTDLGALIITKMFPPWSC